MLLTVAETNMIGGLDERTEEEHEEALLQQLALIQERKERRNTREVFDGVVIQTRPRARKPVQPTTTESTEKGPDVAPSLVPRANVGGGVVEKIEKKEDPGLVTMDLSLDDLAADAKSSSPRRASRSPPRKKTRS